MSKKEEKIKDLQDEFQKIQEQNSDLDVSQYLAKREDHLPDLGTIQIYDYDADQDDASEQAGEVLESMVDLYLGDYPDLIKHKYVQQKMKEDTKVYADTLFLQKMTKRNFLTQLKQVDNGDNSARMHEVVNQSVSQIRDNIKFSQTQRTEFEKFWKDMRKDLGLNEMSESMEQKNQPIQETPEESGKIIDPRSLNEMIDRMLKGNKG
jgi:hypothetical protein